MSEAHGESPGASFAFAGRRLSEQRQGVGGGSAAGARGVKASQAAGAKVVAVAGGVGGFDPDQDLVARVVASAVPTQADAGDSQGDTGLAAGSRTEVNESPDLELLGVREAHGTSIAK